MRTLKSIVLLAVLASLLSTAAYGGTVALDEYSPVASSAKLYVQTKLGPGTPFMTLRFVSGSTHYPTARSLRDKQPVGPTTSSCAFEFLPEGDDVAPVRVSVSQTDGGPWSGGPPECRFEPALCEVLVGRSEALRFVESLG